MRSLVGGHVAAGDEPAVLLAACHARIREHLAMARVLAGASGKEPPAAIVATARGVDRYFRLALPLHVADEEASVVPRLVARADPTLDAALARMRSEHRAHEEAIEALLRATDAIARDPSRLVALRSTLGALVDRLAPELEAHLALEEQTIFPALGALAPHDARAIVLELRARRG